MERGAVACCTVFLLVLIGISTFAGDRLPHPAIVITNDYEFTAENGVCSGTGTANDPYVIESLVIDAGYDDYGIRIHGTTRAFVIRDVEISGAGKSAIYLSYVENGFVENCQLKGNWTGITLNFSSMNRIANCTISANTDGVRFYFSDHNQILTNTFKQNDTAIWLDASNRNEWIGNYISESHMGIYLNLGSKGNLILSNAFVDNLHHAHTDALNLWDDGAAGNYWSGFKALDTDKNGIWDSPYRITSDGDRDNFPLTTHPLVPTPPPATCGT